MAYCTHFAVSRYSIIFLVGRLDRLLAFAPVMSTPFVISFMVRGRERERERDREGGGKRDLSLALCLSVTESVKNPEAMADQVSRYSCST